MRQLPQITDRDRLEIRGYSVYRCPDCSINFYADLGPVCPKCGVDWQPAIEDCKPKA